MSGNDSAAAGLEDEDDPSVTRFRRSKEIFLAVRGLQGIEREDAMARLCGSDEALREMVEKLLRGDGRPLPVESLADDIRAAQSSTMGLNPADSAQTVLSPKELSELDGSRIGRYKLLERIGEGGFGLVFLAEQVEPVRRRVAVKIIKLGMDTRQVVARFEAERQALALMDHPCIARVLDGGSTVTGRPYFVMELVKGLPITEYCDLHRLGLRERLKLVVQVCEALQHAHQRGVIHRDIKPSNVLVADVDGVPTPKIIDFGIAKATSGRLTERTIYTEMRQMIGTPAYMSPEQAGQSEQDVDTRTDVYAAGVLLYELLTGATPFDMQRLASAAYGEVQRIIREEDPPRPSTRVGTKPETLATVAERRATAPTKLGSAIKGDLDWIVMKAMEKDRRRRYDSAGSMGADIGRYLSGYAVEAAPPGRLYLTSKFVRRNRGPVIAGLLVTLALVAGLIGTSLGFFNANRQRDEARREQYLASVQAASALLANNQPSLAIERLNSCDSKLRGWEWQWLMSNTDLSVASFEEPTTRFNGLAVSPDSMRFAAYGSGTSVVVRSAPLGQRICELAGHVVDIHVAAFDPAGTKIATADAIGGVRLFDATSGKLLFKYDGHTQIIWGMAFSPDGSLLCTAARDNTARIWDTRDGRQVHVLTEHTGWVNWASFSPDGSRVVTSSDDGTAIVWEVSSGRRLMTLSGHTGFAGNATFSPDGSRISTSDSACVLRLWDAHSGELAATLRGHADHTGHVWCTQFSHNGRLLLSASADGTARLWDVASGSPLQVLRGHTGAVKDAVFSRDGTRVVTGAQDRTAIVWDVATGDRIGTMVGHANEVRGARFTDDDRMIATCSYDGSVRLWDAVGTRYASATILTLAAFRGSFDPRGERFVVGLQSQIAAIYSLSGEFLFSLQGHTNFLLDAVYSNDGARIVTASADRTARVWDAASGECLLTLQGHAGDVTRACFSADGRRIATASADSTSKLWDAKSGECLATFAGKCGPLDWVEFDPTGRTIVVASTDGTARIWDVQTAKEIYILSGHTKGCTSAVYSPDGTRILTSSRDATVKAWNAADGTLISTLVSDASECSMVRYHPDGTRIVVSSSDGSAKIFDPAREVMIAQVQGHREGLFSCEFSPDGESLLTIAGDFNTRIWHTTPYRERYPAIRAERARVEKAAATRGPDPQAAAESK